MDLPFRGAYADGPGLLLPKHVVFLEHGHEDWPHLSPRSKRARLTANKYVLATKYSKAVQDASTPEQWEEMCIEERDELIAAGICPLCRAHYSNRHSFRTHYQVSRNECKRSKNAEDANRERTKKNKAAARRLADPFADNERKRQRQGHNYKDSDWRAAGYDTYEDYMYDVARGMFCGGTCKD